MKTNEPGDAVEPKLFDVAIDLLKQVDRREFYTWVVEFCASLLDSEVCALYVRTNQIDSNPRVCLVAGRLPPNHPGGRRMKPEALDSDAKQHSYRITAKVSGQEEPAYDGVTGRIASTGGPIRVAGYDSIKEVPGHQGRWDSYVWQGRPAEFFRSMLGVPIRDQRGEIIGVIKVENKASGAYTDVDMQLLEQIARKLAASLLELIEQKRELRPAIEEFEYRVPRATARSFEREQTGEVTIRHRRTAICHSDVYYFRHEKAREKLDERLPLVLGHETTGEIYQVVGEHQYRNGGVIEPKDRVVVIPLIPCGTCSVCMGDYGENYCPSSRFMASNAPGSLRTLYKYDPKLVLKIEDPSMEMAALFTEPMSNLAAC